VIVRRGATIGAGARVAPGVEIGSYALVGIGAVVLRDVAPHVLVLGNPRR
jgi:UDP-2-acetamido-3-amino-2,3-dideoxy-glucuronate N-acetyltransferase